MANRMTREEIIKNAKTMDPTELIERLNEDAANFIEQLPKRKLENPLSLDEWDKEMKNHPLFMTKPIEEGEEMSPLLEALQSLKYDPDENSPDELARSYKEDGNENFKKKKYCWAVDSYTQGLDANCTDQELLIQLYSNRAAAHYHIGNYEKSLKDATAAKSLKKDHMKALERGALCCFNLNKLSDCIVWCDEGLQLCSENKLLNDLKIKAALKLKTDERDRRKAQAAHLKRQKELQHIRKTINERKIQLGNESLEVSEDESMCTGSAKSKVHLNENNKLIWPVMLLYPEYGTSDYIQEFHEESMFIDHLKIMFENDSPTWDEDRKYVPEKMQIYFMDGDCIIPVNYEDILRNILSHKRYKVFDGTPCFFVTVCNSPFDKEFRKKYTVVK